MSYDGGAGKRSVLMGVSLWGGKWQAVWCLDVWDVSEGRGKKKGDW